MTTQIARTYRVPWGPHAALDLEWPGHWPGPTLVNPHLADGFGQDEYPAQLANALDRLQENESLEKMLKDCKRVAVVVDDPSRWTPLREALPLLLERVQGCGIERGDVSICFGVGRHAALSLDDMRARLGADVVNQYQCFSPPVGEIGQYVDLGRTEDNVPVRVFRPVAEADLRILVGSVLPHMQAGFGGGFKLIFPGCSHRSTLSALHRQGLGSDPHSAARLLGSDVTCNPMRRAITRAVARLTGRFFSISHVLGPPGRILRVECGDVEKVQQALAHEVQRRYRSVLPPESADLLVVGNHPWPGDPMQSFKVLLNHRAAAARDGVLVGLFWTDPAEIDRSFPLAGLRAVSASGAAGGLLIRSGIRLADRVSTWLNSPRRFMLRWARELVAERPILIYAPPLHEQLGRHLGPVRIYERLETLWRDSERALGQVPRQPVVFPVGGLTYCPSD